MKNILFSELVNQIRKFQKDSILNMGSKLLHKAFHRYENNDDSEDRDDHLILSFGEKIIYIALACCNNQRKKNIDNKDQFIKLCDYFLRLEESLYCSLQNRECFVSELTKNLEELKNENEVIIPVKYIDKEIINSIYMLENISRGTYSQNQYRNFSVNDFLTDYQILYLIENGINRTFSSLINDSFGMNFKALFKFMLLVAEEVKKYNGFFFEKNLILNEEHKQIKNQLIELSIKESSLYKDWYSDDVLKEKQEYQHYVSCPTAPIIYLDKVDTKIGYSFLMMPLPLMIKSFRENIFSRLFKESRGAAGEILGKAIQTHIFKVLKQIFCNYAVEKFDDNTEGQKADYYIELENIILIIEVKLAISTYKESSTSNPEQVAKRWKKMYGALQQCVSSIKDMNIKTKKSIFPIIVIGNNTIQEGLTFKNYCYKSNILSDEGINFLEIFSWKEFQQILSTTTIEKFENAFIKKSNNANLYVMNIKELIDYNNDNPAHSYEYLQKIYCSDTQTGDA